MNATTTSATIETALPDGLPATITVELAAKVLDIARGSAYRGVERGEIPSVRVGRRILIPVLALSEQFTISLGWLAARLPELSEG